jgi:8-hydroxy-5-deazaflavin:NADPH oxidoreductase
MKIGVLGTGVVGRTIAAKLLELGHGVCVGTRDPAATLAKAEPDRMGTPPFKVWKEQHPAVELVTIKQAAAHGELMVNAMSGVGSVDTLKLAGDALSGKVLLDISNPLDFSKGMPPTLSVCNTDSLGEQIQRAFPELKVVKSLNTMTANLMVAPKSIAGGAHTVFVSGNDAEAKAKVTTLLRSFGWEDILDLGDISSARGTEMYLPLWVRLWGAVQTPMFSIKVVR